MNQRTPSPGMAALDAKLAETKRLIGEVGAATALQKSVAELLGPEARALAAAVETYDQISQCLRIAEIASRGSIPDEHTGWFEHVSRAALIAFESLPGEAAQVSWSRFEELAEQLRSLMSRVICGWIARESFPATEQQFYFGIAGFHVVIVSLAARRLRNLHALAVAAGATSADAIGVAGGGAVSSVADGVREGA